MKTSWFIGLVTLFVIFSVISCIMEMTYLGSGEASRITMLLQPPFPEWKGITTIFTYITVAWGWIANLWFMFWFDYAFFQGSWGLVRYIVFLPISIGVVVSIVLAAVRGVSSG